MSDEDKKKAIIISLETTAKVSDLITKMGKEYGRRLVEILSVLVDSAKKLQDEGAPDGVVCTALLGSLDQVLIALNSLIAENHMSLHNLLVEHIMKRGADLDTLKMAIKAYLEEHKFDRFVR